MSQPTPAGSKRKYLCGSCGANPPAPGRRKCEGCLETSRRRVERLKRSALCTSCGRESQKLGRIHCEACCDRIDAYRRKRQASFKESGLCFCGKRPDPGKKTCPSCLFSIRKGHQQLKQIVVEAYGGRCACIACDETDIRFLEIDHVNNDGAEKRRLRKHTTGSNLYRMIIANNFPPEFQLLCGGCNKAKRNKYPVCPHTYAVEQMVDKLKSVPLTY